jgi:hypothetical protein
MLLADRWFTCRSEYLLVGGSMEQSTKEEREKERKNGSMGQWIKEVLIRQMSL